MLFNSIKFLVFFPIVVLLYFLIPSKLKHIWLLVTSYFFYMCWNAKYILLILFSTVVTYLSGLGLEAAKSVQFPHFKQATVKRLIVLICVTLNLLVLFFFKYFSGFLTLIAAACLRLHIQLNVPTFDIVLPVGISFYTFQALSYTIDVYREDIHAEKNFFYYALFVSFFPQLVAGPIERSGNLLKQLRTVHRFQFEGAKDGLLLMMWGFFLKIVLADRIAIFVDTVYGSYTDYGGWYLIVATLLFAVQIYCDFGGYSVIAMGTAEILGIELMDNFRAPYLTTSIAEFWRNWHISLTSWFKDYMYIPLGGSRKGKCRKYINKLVVFLFSGLWHGADFSFVIWGGLNGLYQVIGEALQPIRDRFVQRFSLNREAISHKLLRGCFCFLLVDFSWIFFRANTVQDAFSIIRQMFAVRNPFILTDGSIFQCGLSCKSFCLMLLSIGLLLFADIFKLRGVALRKVIAAQDSWFQCIFIAVSIAAIMTFGIWGPAYNQTSFIYFQF